MTIRISVSQLVATIVTLLFACSHVDGHHNPRKSGHEDGRCPRPAVVGDSPGVLRRVQGALAALAGFAALDPSSALQARR
jgi:hypothetical protein